MIASKLRLILGLELIAYYFAAPYIILLGLDEKRGLLNDSFSMNERLWAYALLVGVYPFLLMIVSPYIGRQLDQRRSKISILRKIHLANSACYILLAVSCWLQSYSLAIIALCIPGGVGCASPVGKSLIANLTKPEIRTREFAKIAFMKGIVKLCIPLVGALVFKVFLNESSYAPLFLFSCALSFCCFIYSFTFPHIDALECNSSSKAAIDQGIHCSSISTTTPTLSLLTALIRKNYALLLTFVLLITGYSVFVKFTPFVLFEKIGNNPSIVNYFASLVGLAYALNQFVVVRYSDHVKNLIGFIFIILCMTMVLLCFMVPGPLWFLSFFGVLFCFSVLNTCIEARLSLQGTSTNQGTIQGILYSMENWGYIIAPIIGSFVASFSSLSPLYFVTLLAFIAGLFFIYSQLIYMPSESQKLV